MRILSNFKDYYDYLQGYGQDPNLVYERKTSILEVPDEKINLECDITFRLALSSNRIFPCGLFFCDKLFTYYRSYGIDYNYVYNKPDSFVKEDCGDGFKLKNYKVTLPNKVLEAIPYTVPIAFIEPHYFNKLKITLNPKLIDFEFYKELTPELTYQYIAQYLYQNKESKAKYNGEVMNDYVSDDDLIVAKGYDKFSFRKQKK